MLVPKDGVKSTEFYVVLVVNVLVGAGVLTAGEGAELLQAMLVAAVAIVNGAYILGRSWVKADTGSGVQVTLADDKGLGGYHTWELVEELEGREGVFVELNPPDDDVGVLRLKIVD